MLDRIDAKLDGLLDERQDDPQGECTAGADAGPPDCPVRLRAVAPIGEPESAEVDS